MHGRRGDLEGNKIRVFMGMVERHDVPQWVAVRSFMVSMQMIHCNVDSLMGLLACSCCALMVAIRCCSRTFDRPVSSSRSCDGISASRLDNFYAHMQNVE